MPGVDYIYVPYNRVFANYDRLTENIIGPAIVFVDIFKSCPISDDALSLFCYHLLPLCGTVTAPRLPSPVCSDTCSYAMDTCPEEWASLLLYVNLAISDKETVFVGCNDTGADLEPLPYCCSNFGIDIRT